MIHESIQEETFAQEARSRYYHAPCVARQRWYFESGSVKIGKYWFDNRTIGTTSGVTAMVNEVSGNGIQNDSGTGSADTNPNNNVLPL